MKEKKHFLLGLTLKSLKMGPWRPNSTLWFCPAPPWRYSKDQNALLPCCYPLSLPPTPLSMVVWWIHGRTYEFYFNNVFYIL